MNKILFIVLIFLLSIHKFVQSQDVVTFFKKINENGHVFLFNKNQTIDIPSEGFFLYSSMNSSLDDSISGYGNNEDYITNISSIDNRKIFLRTNYFVTEDNDVLYVYDGPDTNSAMIFSFRGKLDVNKLILSSGSQLTLRFKSNQNKTSTGFRLRIDNGPSLLNGSAPQPSPSSCASTPAADECVSAPLICDLSGYCGNTSSAYTAGNTSGLGSFCGSIENNSWLSFVASSTSASLGFTSGGCQDSNSGIQAVIYASNDCNNFTEVSNCNSQGSGSGSFTITTNVSLVPGQKYYVMIDGYAGNVCNYTVTAQSGVALTPQIIPSQTQVCPGYSLSLESSIVASTYTWTSNPPGTYPNSQTIVVNPTVTTTYTLLVGASACSPSGGSTSQVIQVTNVLNPANITAPNPVCMGENVSLTSLTNGGTYSWSGPNGFSSSSQNPTINNWSTSNNGTYSLTINYGPGCSTQTATLNITGTPTPTINISASPSSTICSGQSIVLTGSGGGTGANAYSWNWNVLETSVTTQFCISVPFVGMQCSNSPFPIPGISAGATATATPNQSTQICVSSSNAAGCSGQKCINITVLPAAPALTVSPSTTICPGQTSTLTVAGGGTYTWSPGIGLSSTSGATVSANPTTTTIYTVSSSGCGGSSQSQTVSITVNGTPPNIGTIQGPTSICSNATGMSYSVTNVAGATYSWTAPAGATITSGQGSNVISIDYGSTAGTIAVTASTSCGTSTASLVVNLTPNLTLSVTPNNPSICPGSTTTLTASGATNYTWSPVTNLSATSGSVVTANPNSTITYTVNGASGTCTGSTTVQVTVGGNLNISVTPISATICPSATTALIASGATNYTWSPSASINNPNSASVTANPSSSTTYTVAGENGGCTGSTTVQVVVANNLGLTVSPTSPTICPLGSATLTVSGATNYTWSPSSSVDNPNSSSVIANPSVTTTYTINGENNGCTGSTTVQITVSNSLVVTVSPATATICPGGTVTLTASGGTSYTWSPSSGLSSTSGTSVIANPTTASSYTVLGADASGCFGTATANINVANNLGVTATPSSTTICPGGTVTLSANGATTYTWSPPASLSGTSGNSVVANPTINTTYTVVGASGACTGTTNVTVTIGNSPTITVNSATICSNQSTILSASGASSYTWSNGASTSTISVSPSSTDSYTVTGTMNGCTGYSISTVSVTSTPTLVLSHDTSIIYGNSVPLVAGGGTTYSWTPSSALSCNDCSNPTASPTITTQYCVISANGNCYDTSCVVISVEKPCYSNAEYGAPNAFSPNGDGLNDEFCLSGWKDCVTDFFVAIYDRWGTKVFESTDAAFCWDGKYQGKDLDPAVFVFYIKAEIQNVGSITKKGNISLIR